MQFSNSFIAKTKTDKTFLVFISVFALPLVLTLILIFFKLNTLRNQIPLFYSQIWGETQLGSRLYIFLPIVGSFIFGFLYFVLAHNFYSTYKVIVYLLVGSAILVSLLSAITIFNIVRIIS